MEVGESGIAGGAFPTSTTQRRASVVTSPSTRPGAAPPSGWARPGICPQPISLERTGEPHLPLTALPRRLQRLGAGNNPGSVPTAALAAGPRLVSLCFVPTAATDEGEKEEESKVSGSDSVAHERKRTIARQLSLVRKPGSQQPAPGPCRLRADVGGSVGRGPAPPRWLSGPGEGAREGAEPLLLGVGFEDAGNAKQALTLPRSAAQACAGLLPRRRLCGCRLFFTPQRPAGAGNAEEGDGENRALAEQKAPGDDNAPRPGLGGLRGPVPRACRPQDVLQDRLPGNRVSVPQTTHCPSFLWGPWLRCLVPPSPRLPPSAAHTPGAGLARAPPRFLYRCTRSLPRRVRARPDPKSRLGKMSVPGAAGPSRTPLLLLPQPGAHEAKIPPARSWGALARAAPACSPSAVEVRVHSPPRLLRGGGERWPPALYPQTGRTGTHAPRARHSPAL